MTTRYGTMTTQAYGGAGQTGVQCVRCTYSGAAASGDTIVFGDTLIGGAQNPFDYQSTIPQGADMVDAIVRVSDASTSITMSAGYAAADASTGTTNSVADVNTTYFLTATAVAATGIKRADGPATVVKLQRPTNPTLTITAGAVGSEAVLELDVFYYYHSNQGANTVEDA